LKWGRKDDLRRVKDGDRGNGGALLVPGPNPIGILRTILLGIAGSFLGGLVGHLLFGWRYRYSGLAGFVLAVAFTALIVYLIDGRDRRSAAGSRSSTWR
jgi:uncharacterized membrane protein YeaQ/YmgE (transglycosylase-associated protein family)